MANQALAILQQARPPSKFQQVFEDKSNIVAPVTVPSLSPGGKRWTITVNGKSTVVQRRNEDGDFEPISTLRVVVVDYNQRRGRAYYEGTYNPDEVKPPACWSEDGIVPEHTVEVKQAAKCELCPHSKKTLDASGRETTACKEHRMIALVPVATLAKTLMPLRMKISITSDWDGRSPDHEAEGWYGFSNYMKMLRANNVAHSAQVVTKMKFDSKVDYPKVLFSIDRYTTEEEQDKLVPLIDSDEIKTLLGGFTPAGADGVPKERAKAIGTTTDTDSGGVAQNEAAAQQAAAEAAKQQAAAELAAKKAAQKAAADKKKADEAAAAAQKAAEEEAARKAAAEADDGGDEIIDFGDGEIVNEGTPAAAAAANAKPVTPANSKPATPAKTTQAAAATPAAKTPPAAAAPSVLTDDVRELITDWDNM